MSDAKELETNDAVSAPTRLPLLGKEIVMTDQCKHCTARGDLSWCLKTECFHHKNWISEQHRERLEVVRDALQLVVGFMDLDEPHQAAAFTQAKQALLSTA